VSTTECGGCRGIGSHRRFCPHHPDYHPWKQLAQMAEDIGDRIGSNDTGLANRAYALSGAIKDAIPNHPYGISREPL
jgi:hypothetical protein